MNNFYHYQYPNFPTQYQNVPAQKSTLKRRLFQGFFDIIGIVVCAVAFIIIFTSVEPRIQYYTCDMSDVSFPKVEDTVEVYVVGLYGILVPPILILLIEIYNADLLWWQNKEKTDRKGRFRKFGICIFHGISLFLFGLSMCLLLTEIGKVTVGRLRPHFLDVCKPDFRTINCFEPAQQGSIYKPIYTGGSFCTGDKTKVKEARLSFPSGHSSVSAYTMLFLMIYLEARFVQMETRFIKVLLQLSAFIVAFYTGLSRLVDYAHRASDILGGAILGLIIALLMTLVVGKIIWIYEKKTNYQDPDLKQKKKASKQENYEIEMPQEIIGYY